MKLPHTKVKFYPEVKSQTGLCSLRVSCKRALKLGQVWRAYAYLPSYLVKGAYAKLKSLVPTDFSNPHIFCLKLML